ncbi:MAG: S9 family peptidase, partial [Chloroflexota bacterium]
PQWSPDGSLVSAVGHWEAQAGGAPDSSIWTVSSSGGEAVNVTPDFERSTADAAMSDMFQGSSTSYVWAPDGSAIYFLASDSGATEIFRVDLEGHEVTKLTAAGDRISGVSIDRSGRTLAYVSANATNPGDLFQMPVDDATSTTRLTKVNWDFLNEIALSEPEEFWVDSEDGAPIQGWVMRPLGFDPAVKYPMILQIHGGPHGMYANAFMHEFQLMAARGYVVVYSNPRGSAGYGESFTRSTHQNWGEADLPDLMAVVDHVVKQGYVDENRLGVTGGSYGGYMTLWTIGHSDRFKAAVTQRCVSNLYSFYGTSDIGWNFGEYNFGGTPWEQRDHFMKYSPITYVADMKTPLLIIHSERDFRCPIEQGEQVFISLKRLGRDVEFVRFPDETHNLSRSGKPKHRIERLGHIIGWFDRYL